MNKRTALIIAFLAILCLSFGSALAVMYYQRTLDMTASIKVVGEFGVFFDPECTLQATTYDWGEFDIFGGYEEKSLILYFKSKANAPIEITWTMTDDDAIWIFDDYVGYYNPVYEIASREWVLLATLELETWIPTDSTSSTGTHVLAIASHDEVQSATIILAAYQSTLIYDPLGFILTFESYDTY